MGIFYKRPLCLFCFCFIASSLLATVVGFWGKIILMAINLLLSALLFLLARHTSKRKYGLIEAAICTLFACAAAISSILAIDLPTKKLEKFISQNAPIEFVVCETTSTSKYYTTYEGILLSTDKGTANAKAYLNFEHEADYAAGDKLLLIGDVTFCESDTNHLLLPSDVKLEITSTIDKDLVILNSFDGFSLSVTAAKLRRQIRNIFCEILDPDSAALSLGILTSDTSMLKGAITRDFRRAGISHLLAVSGLHLSLIVGVFEFLLIKLRLKKSLRCIATTALALLLLIFSGFSLSAMRSVLMLLVAYLCYALSREPDTLTSLSVAATLILLISPVSVGSLSFWLSFLATLGIILYSELLSTIHIRRRKGKNAVSMVLLNILRKITSALIVTLSANVFICIIFFLAFGETSVISPIANLTATPLGEIYLVLSVLTLLCGRLSVIGPLLCRATSTLCSLITSLAKYLSALDFSVVSLRYAFAGIIISAMTLSLAVLFIVKLKDKRWLFAPPTIAIAAFCVCLLVYNTANTHTKAVYTSESGRDSVAISSGGELLIIDASDGSYTSLYNSYEWAKENAIVETDSILLTHYHVKHISSLGKFFGRVITNKIYLPEPETSDELLILKDITRLAIENGITPTIYKESEILNVGSNAIFVPKEISAESSSRKIISFVVNCRDGLLYYVDALSFESNSAYLGDAFKESCDVLIIGSHSPLQVENKLKIPSSPKEVIIADTESYTCEISFKNNR